jgi:hypothetical protein
MKNDKKLGLLWVVALTISVPGPRKKAQLVSFKTWDVTLRRQDGSSAVGTVGSIICSEMLML